MKEKIEAFRNHVIACSANPEFIHHEWFVDYHLNIVHQIAMETCGVYPNADRDMVETLVWLHDYGKILDFERGKELTLSAGREKMTELGFEARFVDMAIRNAETVDSKLEVDLREANLEVRILSSADAASHFIGPFFSMWWHENPGKPFRELMADNVRKARKDWDRKLVIPEIREMVEPRYKFLLEQCGQLPEKFLP